MIKKLVFILLISIAFDAAAQDFPTGWVGNWKGELLWYSGKGLPKTVKMELSIQPTDSTHRYTWKMSYSSPGEDTRPYHLIGKDTAKGHWVIDENNGIVLDQYLVANRLTGAFTVQSSTIINSYWLENDTLHVEFNTISAEPVSKTGKGDANSPFVSSYRVKGYQRAALTRQR